MPEQTEYVHGTPSWIDVSSPDIPATKTFYEDLFGWTAEDSGPAEVTGGYGMFRLRGRLVAGYGPAQGGAPPSWTTYFDVDDADKTCEVAKQAGGAVFMEPMDVLDVGRMAVLADPQGAVFSVWQPRAHKGAELVREPGAFQWTELNTTDLQGAKAFYTHVFGWGAKTFEGEMPYTEFTVADADVAGMMTLPEEAASAGAPPHWLAYLGVDDCDSKVEKARALGAEMLAGPFDVPEAGRLAVLRDPQGAVFAVIKAKENLIS